MAPAPWEAVSPSEQLFVLVTGANSGVGLGACKRLIDEFLATRSLSSHLILLPTTRSPAKSLETIRTLRQHAAQTARASPSLRARASGWQDAVARVHVLSPQLDLCDLRGVRDFARRLCEAPLSNPEGLEGEYLRDVRVPRLDSVYFNAAYGNWLGTDYLLAIWTMLKVGPIKIFTWPSFYSIKRSLPTSILNEKPRSKYPPSPALGEVFCACFFGHYMLAHHLGPLLSRRPDDGIPPARLIWASSLEATRSFFDISDIQAVEAPEPYESAKRLSDLVALTSASPATRPYTERYFRPEGALASQKFIPPKMYTTHCGIVVTGLMPVHWYLMWAYDLILLLCRYIGSPWHTLTGYSGAKAAVYITLEEQAALDEAGIERTKLGSCTDRFGREGVKLTEVEGYGWDGKPVTAETLVDDTAVGIYQKKIGRRVAEVEKLTHEDLAEFEALGAECWKKLEAMRLQWEAILDDEEKQ